MYIIVEEIKNNIENIIQDENMNNYIIGEMDIKEEDINRDIRFISNYSLGNIKEENKWKYLKDFIYMSMKKR